MAIAPTTLSSLRKAIRAAGDPDDARFLQRFFKTGRGEYAEGDRFLGIRVPESRRLARAHRGLPIDDAFRLLQSTWHEERLIALILLVDAYGRGTVAQRRRIHSEYLANTRYINNWDLVDMSAEHIVGPQARETGSLRRIETLSRSPDLWRRRIAMLATFHFIKQDEFDPALAVMETLMQDDEDLIRKACGWMLREIWQRDRGVAERFLTRFQRDMPRTMLRYAIEKMPAGQRREFLDGTGRASR